MRPALLIALCLLFSGAPAARSQQEEQSCESARAELGKYLDTFSRSCRVDSDCDGYYCRADACLPAVVVRKHKLAGKREQRLLARQQAVGEACTLKYRARPACSPIPFRAVCRKDACVDAQGGPAFPRTRQPPAGWVSFRCVSFC